MRVVVTRPQREAHAWVRELAGIGFDALALPLIEIAPVSDPQPVQAAWRHLADFAGVMFVSGHAVEGFFAARSEGVPDLDAVTRAWATGPGTRAALLRAGVRAQSIDAPCAGQFDSEALWDVMRAQVRAGSRVLIVRGADGQAAGQTQGGGRDWFAAQVQAAGGQAQFVVAYRRCLPAWSQAQLRQARDAAADGSVWLFSSSEAVANLGALLPAQDWRAARAVATHARIAAAARALGFAVVRASRPTLADIKASIESLP